MGMAVQKCNSVHTMRGQTPAAGVRLRTEEDSRQIGIHLIIAAHDLAELFDLAFPVGILVVENRQVISNITVLDPVEVDVAYFGDRLGVKAVVDPLFTIWNI